MKTLKDSISESRGINEGFNATKIVGVLNEIKNVVLDPRKGKRALQQAFDGSVKGAALEGWRVFTLKFCEWLLQASEDEDLFKKVINNWQEASGYQDILDEINDEYEDLDDYDYFTNLWSDIVYGLTKSHVNWENII